MRQKNWYMILAALAATALAMTTAWADTTTVTVEANGDGGWSFNGDPDNTTPYEFSTDQAVLGSGSLHVLPITNTVKGNADKFTAAQVLNIPVADFDSLSTDFLVDGGGASAYQQFYVNVYTNFATPVGWYDCRFDYVATTGSTSSFTTLTAASGATPTAVAAKGAPCPATLAEMEAGSTVSFVVVNIGDTSANDAGVGGYFDNAVLATAAGTTVFDFDVPAPSKDDCKDGGYADLGFDNQGQCVSTVQADEHAGK